MEREREATLDKLREAGVVHLKKTSANGSIGPSTAVSLELLGRQARNRMALGALFRYPVKEDVPAPYTPLIPDEGDLADHILTLVDQKKLLLEELPPLLGERQRIKAWGNFDPLDFFFLAEHGVKLYLYSLPVPSLAKLGDDTEVLVVFRDKYWAKVLSVGAKIPGMKPFEIPELSLSEIESQINSLRLRIGEIETRLAGLAYHKNIIEEDNGHILDDIEYEAARSGMGSLEDESTNIAIAWLSGFVPNDKINVLIRAATDNGWTLAWDDPSLEDRPPTILKNRPAVRIIQPLFSMLGTIPGYWEEDISLSYMVFLSVFFAMIFGDAGYGLLLFCMSAVIGIFLKKKSGKANGAGAFPDAAKLLMLFSFCTIVWGTITGSWFAIPAANLPPVLRLLIVPPFNNSGAVAEFPLFLQNIFHLPKEVPVDTLKTQWNIQFLCFTIGLVQLVLARTKNVIKKLPSLSAVAEAGWIIAMAGIYFLVLFMLLKMPPPSFTTPLIAAGLALNFIFAEQNGGNFFINILKSFSNFFSIFLKAIGCFADIISYIRLFAVGIAGGLIAQTFNSMAIPAEGLGSLSLGFVLKLLIAVVGLAGGHGLNLLMSTLSVIIHGVRLNLLEYAGNHLGMDWSGYAYKPFALRNKELKEEEFS